MYDFDARRIRSGRSGGMKPRDFYTDWRLLVGAILIITGTVNWAIGFTGTKHYGQVVATSGQEDVEELTRPFDELDDSSNQAVLEPLIAVERKASLDSAQMDFYHAIFFVGQSFFAGGLILMLIGLFATLRRDAKTANHDAGPV